MPQFEVSTKAAKSIWKSPDGQREIFEVQLDYKGQTISAKTYSKDISTPGWTGTVESYEKTGQRGAETFVKQPPKEGGYPGKSSGSGSRSSGGSRSDDTFTMYLSYAKDLAVALIDNGVLDKAAYAEVLADVIAGGQVLYEGRPNAQKEESVSGMDKVAEVDASQPITLEMLDDVFTPPKDGPEAPWGS